MGNREITKILVVDDEPANLLAMQAVLRELGEEIVPAKSGREALRKLLTEEFAVILMDVVMPGIDGFEAARLIRQHKRTRDIPLIFTTAASPGDIEVRRGYALGAADFVFKPFLPSALCAKIKVLVELHKQKQRIQRESLLLLRAREAEHEKELAFRASRAKSIFLASMGHEIRTPLNAIMGMATLLKDTKLTSEQSRYVSIFERAGTTLATLINDLLDLSKIEENEMQLESLAFDLREVSEGVCELMALKAHDKGIELHLDISPQLETRLIGDPHRFRQILLNLVGNAIKFTNRGEVILRITPETENREAILIAVKDTGIGIAQGNWEKVFNTFQQGDVSVARRFGGSGLGLAITRRLVELMGGRIWLESVLNQGTTFFATLSFERNRKALPREEYGNFLTGKRALHISGNATSRAILRRTLESWGAQVEEGLERSDGRHDFIFAEDAHVVSQLADSKKVIALLTAREAHSAVAALTKIGVKECLVRPVKYSELARALSPSPKPSTPSARDATAVALCGTMVPPEKMRPVLIVDDAEENREILIAYLGGLPLRIESAVDGTEALRRFQESDYGLILMDMQMPGMDGFQTTREIRRLEQEQGRAATPIIALTASAFKQDRDLCLAAGCSLHLAKPVFRDKLLEVVRDLYHA